VHGVVIPRASDNRRLRFASRVRFRPPNTLAQAAHGPKKRNNSDVYSISTLLTRNLHDVFGENDPARRRAQLTKSSRKIACSKIPRERLRGRDEIDRIAARSRLLTLTFDISQ